MRSTIIKGVIAVVILVAIVFCVRLFACSGFGSGLSDPNFDEYKSNNEQVTLRGFFLDEASSTDETAKVFVVFGVVENGSGFTAIDSYISSSAVRFLSLDDEHDYLDVMSTTSAAAFREKNICTCAYGFTNTIKGVKLTQEQTLMVASFDIDRASLESAETVTVWFDICDALTNETSSTAISREQLEATTPGGNSTSNDTNAANAGTAGGNNTTSTPVTTESKTGYDNVIIEFPASLLTTVSDEKSITNRY